MSDQEETPGSSHPQRRVLDDQCIVMVAPIAFAVTEPLEVPRTSNQVHVSPVGRELEPSQVDIVADLIPYFLSHRGELVSWLVQTAAQRCLQHWRFSQ